MKVLLVEDLPLAAKIAKYILVALGCEVDWAANAEDALNKAYHERYVLILMDIGLPDCTGLEVTQKIRAHGIATPIYALTAHTDAQQKHMALASGMNGFLIKPLEEEEVRQLLLKHREHSVMH